MAIKPKASAYSNLNDTEFLGYDEGARKKWGEIEKHNTRLLDLQKQLADLGPMENVSNDFEFPTDPAVIERNQQRDALQNQINYYSSSAFTKLKTSLQGEAQVLETKRENRGAAVTQGGVNTKTGVAGAEAITQENLLSQNINQEITGRISRNLLQAREAQEAVETTRGATLGQQVARAGQAGVAAASGTTRAMADAATSKAEADKAAIEGYRIGAQNLLMGQGEAATKAAESLTGSINKTTEDWGAKSTSAVTDVTGTLLKDVEQITALPGFSGDARTQGVKDAEAAVGTTLKTWNLDAYMDVLNTLTAHSANKSTWDQMLLEQQGAPTNPYEQYGTLDSATTKVAGTSTSSNLLAAAAATENLDNVYTLSSSSTKKKTGSLL